MRALEWHLMSNDYRVENNTISPTTKACLFNSFNFNFRRLKAKKKARPLCKMIHRVDGPIATYRGFDDGTDNLIREWNNELAEATVFQSQYSLEAHKKLGLSLKKPHFVIPNSPDPKIFIPPNKPKQIDKSKIRLISTSWSDNPNKGLDTYKWLDQNLDWSCFEYTFIGRIQAHLSNIKHIEPVGSDQVAQYLKGCDIYITASRHDPCSNSLLEALSCGLPAVYLNSGGHGELVHQAGLPFHDPTQIPDLLHQVADNYDLYRSRIVVHSIDEITLQYLKVMGLE